MLLHTDPAWPTFWQLLDAQLRALPPTHELFYYAAYTPEDELPAMDHALDAIAQEDAA